MTETLLRDFFAGRAKAPALAEGLQDVLGRRPLHRGANLQIDLEDDVSVETADLVRLCDGALEGDLDPDDLGAAARFLVAADHFTWDRSTPGGALVDQVLLEWSAAQTHYPLTTSNLHRYRKGLVSGSHPFTRG